MESWEQIESVGTEEEATLVVGFLETHGIRASVESLFFHQEPMTFGQLGEVRILVPAADAERARQVLEARDEERREAREGEGEV